MEHGKLVAQGTPAELAHQYVKKLDVKIETALEQMEDALDVLSNTSSLTSGLPRRTNGSITLTVTGREAIPELMTLLVNQGIRVYRLAANEPSLEDVYFALHGEKENE
jgi:ABC-2 type transport system ATP-binding protein